MGATYRGFIRSTRRMMQFGIEEEYGELPLPGGLDELVFYDELHPLQPAWTTVSRQEDGNLQSEPVPVGGIYEIRSSFFVYGSGQWDAPPAWMKLLETAGLPINYARTHGATGTGQTTYEPSAPKAKSAAVVVYYGNVKHRATGCRGEIQFNAEAGQPMRVDLAMKGKFFPREFEDRPTGNTGPIVPPRVINSNFTLIGEESGEIGAVVKSFSIDPGFRTALRNEDDGTGNATEVFLMPTVEPSWNVVLEVDKYTDWGTIFEEGEKFSLSVTIGVEQGKLVKFYTPIGYSAKLMAMPTYGDVGGVRVQNLQFRLLEDTFIRVEHL